MNRKWNLKNKIAGWAVAALVSVPVALPAQEKPNNPFISPFDFPLLLSGNFGELRANHFHGGVDFKTQGVVGKPIRCIADGYISRVTVTPGGYGQAVYITHDNGYTSVHGHVLRFDPAIAKVVEDYTQNGDKNDTYAYMDKETVKELYESGLVVFENHSYNMHSNTGRKGCAKKRGESNDEYRKILENDLLKAHNLIYECTNRHPIAMVYPFGSTSKEAYEVITKLGYVMSFSCTEGINVITKNPKSLFMLKRFNRTPYKNSQSFFADKLY